MWIGPLVPWTGIFRPFPATGGARDRGWSVPLACGRRWAAPPFLCTVASSMNPPASCARTRSGRSFAPCPCATLGEDSPRAAGERCSVRREREVKDLLKWLKSTGRNVINAYLCQSISLLWQRVAVHRAFGVALAEVLQPMQTDGTIVSLWFLVWARLGTLHLGWQSITIKRHLTGELVYL